MHFVDWYIIIISKVITYNKYELYFYKIFIQGKKSMRVFKHKVQILYVLSSLLGKCYICKRMNYNNKEIFLHTQMEPNDLPKF